MFDHSRDSFIEACGVKLDEVRHCFEDAVRSDKEGKWSSLIEGIYKQADKYPLEVLLLAAVQVGKALVSDEHRAFLSVIRVMVKGGKDGLSGEGE